MNVLYKKKPRYRIFQFILTFFLIVLSLTGTDCEKTVISNGGIPPQMKGNWKLVEQTGALIDICPDETIEFQSDGIAILTCPNSNPITRNFTVESNVLTYTQTSVVYSIETLTNDSLYLFGENVSRNLRYLKIITGNTAVTKNAEENLNNSSEVRR